MLLRGTATERPEVCPEDVYSVMLRCWEYRIQERACFNEVFNSSATIHHKNTSCLLLLSAANYSMYAPS